MTSAMLRLHVTTLRLRSAAPWPRETATAQEMIRAWRREQRLRLAKLPADSDNIPTKTAQR
jgi:hypothetical protein